MKKVKIIKVLFLFLFCAVFTMGANAQNTFNKGDKIVNLGIGVGSTYTYYGSALPIAGSFEVGIKDNLFDENSSLGVGAYLGLASKDHYTFIYPGVRGALHYQFVENLDTYAGLMIGLRYISWSYGGSNESYNDLIIPIYIGARYYFNEKIGAFAELGHGIAYLQLGVSIKF